MLLSFFHLLSCLRPVHLSLTLSLCPVSPSAYVSYTHLQVHRTLEILNKQAATNLPEKVKINPPDFP